MTHKRCIACKRSKPCEEFSTGNNKCKPCRKTKAAEKRKAEVAQAAEDAEVATIKKSQHSGHQRRYWLPPGRTGAERLKGFYSVAAPVDEAEVLETVKAAMAMLRLQWNGGPMPADPLGFDFRLAAAMWGVA